VRERSANRYTAFSAMEIRHEFPVSRSASTLARQALDGWLSDLVGEETANAARLAASELVSNAVRHGDLGPDDTIRLAGTATEDIIRVEVEQPSSAAAAHVVAPGERGPLEGGYGLRIVEELSSAWGIRADAPGAVWFEVDRDVREATPPEGL
jgi:anti-sigma regulatory factor (Ser/Thr protein kinase)